jgi:putative transposase
MSVVAVAAEPEREKGKKGHGPLMGVRVRLEPTFKQRHALVCHAGAARFAYNWGLGLRQKAWAYAQKGENAISLHKLLNSLKQEHYPWMYEVSKCAMQEALRDLDSSYKNWWRRLGEGKSGRAAGAPKFKSRQRDGIGGFRLTGAIRVEYVEIAGKKAKAVKGGVTGKGAKPAGRRKREVRAYIHLPRVGRVRLSEAERFPEGALTQVSVSEHAGHWYVSAHVPAAIKVKHGQRERKATPEGVDVGISALATLSDGTKILSPKALRRGQKKLRRLERQKSRRTLGSRNRAKTKAKIARTHERIANQRKDSTHKLTTMLATRNWWLVIEDLNVKGMTKNHSLALSLSDAAFGEIRRQLTYKCDWYGCGLELAPRFFPSTQTCSDCGLVKTGDDKLKLSQRTFCCDGCGLVLDRDENAARVLASLYGSEHTTKVVAASCAETQNACGAGSSGSGNHAVVKLPAMKQEPDRAVAAPLAA